MFTPEVTHVLLVIILVLTVLVGIALLIAVSLAIKTIFEVFALVRTVRAEVGTVAHAIRSAGEGIASKFGIVSAITNFFGSAKERPAAPKKAPKKRA